MPKNFLTRRELLNLALFAGISGLVGCSSVSQSPTLSSTSETLPKQWLKQLPSPWKYQAIKSSSLVNPFPSILREGNDLVALSDGWLSSLPLGLLRPIDFLKNRKYLDDQTQTFLSGLGNDLALRVFPVFVSPWVLLFRKGEHWLEDASESWSVLLDPSLKKQLVLPRSPRLVMSISDRIGSKEDLKRLRSNALTYDDRNALNWVVNGEARVAVLPLNRCLSTLSRDPRLSIALPKSGAPLHWTCLVHSATSREAFPENWIMKAWDENILGKLLANGWLPTLRQSEFVSSQRFVPEIYHPLVFVPKSTWSLCWSLPLLTFEQRNEMEYQWNASAP